MKLVSMPLLNHRLSILQMRHFVDIDNIEVGSIEDLILDIQTLKPLYLVLGAGFFEEFLEVTGDRENIDELADLDLVEMLDEENFRINASLEKLPRINSDELPTSQILFSDMSRFTIRDNANNDIMATIVDFVVSKENPKIVLSSHALHDRLKPFGYGQRFEIYCTVNKMKIDPDKSLILVNKSLDTIVEHIQSHYEPQITGKIHVYDKT